MESIIVGFFALICGGQLVNLGALSIILNRAGKFAFFFGLALNLIGVIFVVTGLLQQFP